MSHEALKGWQQSHVINEQNRRADVANVQEIRTLCKMAGCPDRANLFIAEGISVSDVIRRIQSGDVGEAKPLVESQDDVFRAEYARHNISQQGISEVAYIRSRRIDEGLDGYSGFPGVTLNEIKHSGL